jgi:hypothetical protein
MAVPVDIEALEEQFAKSPLYFDSTDLIPMLESSQALNGFASERSYIALT